jgi:hypothetical protein
MSSGKKKVQVNVEPSSKYGNPKTVLGTDIEHSSAQHIRSG